MSPLKWLLSAIVLGLALPAQGQILPPLPMIQAADLFTDAVTIEARLPALINAAQQGRALYYFDPQAMTWQTYPLGPAEELPLAVIPRSDGSYRLHYLTHSTPNGDVNPAYNRLFVPPRGIVDAPVVCGLVQAAPGEGVWRFTLLDGEQEYRLCHTRTGQLTGPLPSGITGTPENPFLATNIFGCVEVYHVPGEKPVLSPDGRWLLFETCRPVIPSQQNLYSYDLLTDEIRALGSLENAAYLDVHGWLDDQTPILEVAEGIVQGGSSLYTADLARPDSLIAIATIDAYGISLFDHPWRAVIPTGIPSAQDDRLHDGFWIFQQDLRTGARQILAEYWYATPHQFVPGPVLQADEKMVAVRTHPGPTPIGPFYVFDGSTGELLYESERMASVWAAAGDALVYEEDTWPPAFGLLTVDEGAASLETLVVLSEEAPVPARLLFSPDRTRFIYEDESRYWLFDVPRRTTAPLTQATEYDLTLHWLDDDRLEVEVRGDPLCQGCGTTAQLARWQVRLPGAIPAQQPDDPCPELADRTPSGIVFDPAQEGDIIDQLAAGTLDYLNAGGAPAGLESALEHALPDAAPSSLTAGVAQARAAYRQAQQAYPPGTQGYQYAAMAGALFQTYEQTGSLDRACAAAERALQAAQGGDDPGIAYDDDPVHFGFYYESGIRYSADPDDLFAVPEGLRGMVHSPVCFGD